MSSDTDKAGAAVKVPPPLIFLSFMAVAWGLNSLLPLNFDAWVATKFIGITLVTLSIAIIIYLARVFSQAKTSLEPWKPTTQLITTGLYAYSRNPIYVALAILPIGFGLFFGNIWLVLCFFPACLLTHHLVITREESYLERKFGEDYLGYKRKVRRWI